MSHVALVLAVSALLWCAREIATAGFRLSPRYREARRLKFRTISRVGGASLALALPACFHEFVGGGESYTVSAISRMTRVLNNVAESSRKAESQARVAADAAIKAAQQSTQNQALLQANRQVGLADQLASLLIEGDEGTIVSFLDQKGPEINGGTIRQALQEISAGQRPVISIIAERMKSSQSLEVFKRLFGEERFDANDVIIDKDYEKFIERQPLWYAIRYANVPLARTLLQMGAYPHPAQTIDGRWQLDVEYEIVYPVEWMNLNFHGTSSDRIAIANLLREHGLFEVITGLSNQVIQLCSGRRQLSIDLIASSAIRRSAMEKSQKIPKRIKVTNRDGAVYKRKFSHLLTISPTQATLLMPYINNVTKKLEYKVLHSNRDFEFIATAIGQTCRVPGEARFADCLKVAGWGYELINGEWVDYYKSAQPDHELKSVEVEYSC